MADSTVSMPRRARLRNSRCRSSKAVAAAAQEARDVLVVHRNQMIEQ